MEITVEYDTPVRSETVTREIWEYHPDEPVENMKQFALSERNELARDILDHENPDSITMTDWEDCSGAFMSEIADREQSIDYDLDADERKVTFKYKQ